MHLSYGRQSRIFYNPSPKSVVFCDGAADTLLQRFVREQQEPAARGGSEGRRRSGCASGPGEALSFRTRSVGRQSGESASNESARLAVIAIRGGADKGTVLGSMNARAVWAPPRPRLFFMHLPKTAGMALRLFLGNQYPFDRIMPANDWRELLAVDLADFKRYDLFQGHFSCGLMDVLPADVSPIIFLREPVARTISHLKHLRRDPEFSPAAYKLAAGRSLDELVHDEYIMKLCCDVQSALLCNDIPAETILAGLRGEALAGRVPDPDAFAAPPDLATAEESLERFRFVGLVEDFQEDILRLSMELGLHPPYPLPKRNFDPEGATDRMPSIPRRSRSSGSATPSMSRCTSG
jgi:hypothetical protein